MLFIVGLFVVFGCVVTGYTAHGGNLGVLWQPYEVLIIVGAAFGAFLISNPMHVVKGVLGSFKNLIKGTPHNKEEYLELLVFIFNVFKVMKTKGMLEIEADIENPHESERFKQYPTVLHNHHALEFFCDAIRMMTMGLDNHYQMDDLLTEEIDIHHHELEEISMAVTNMADGLPALGIVAAVLGVINTMGSITEPPEILGGLIGAALVGTFLGVLLSYGVVAPMGTSMGKFGAGQTAYFNCIKIAILAHLQGNAPVVTVEFVRKAIPGHLRPSFQEAEDRINGPTEG